MYTLPFYPPINTILGLSSLGSSGRSGITSPQATQAKPTWDIAVSGFPEGLHIAGNSFNVSAATNTLSPQGQIRSFN